MYTNYNPWIYPTLYKHCHLPSYPDVLRHCHLILYTSQCSYLHPKFYVQSCSLLIYILYRNVLTIEILNSVPIPTTAPRFTFLSLCRPASLPYFHLVRHFYSRPHPYLCPLFYLHIHLHLHAHAHLYTDLHPPLNFCTLVTVVVFWYQSQDNFLVYIELKAGL